MVDREERERGTLHMETFDAVAQVGSHSCTCTRSRADKEGKGDREWHGGGVADEGVTRVSSTSTVEEEVIGHDCQRFVLFCFVFIHKTCSG